MNAELYTEPRLMASLPPPDPREPRVVPLRPEYPETEATIAAARQQQREDRCQAIAEEDDEASSREARLMIVLFCEKFGPERVHRWCRNQGLIQNGVNYCEVRK